MTLILGLIAAALILVFFEVILPGGILGLMAAACIVAATWLGFSEFGIVGGASVFIGSLVAIVVFVWNSSSWPKPHPRKESF